MNDKLPDLRKYSPLLKILLFVIFVGLIFIVTGIINKDKSIIMVGVLIIGAFILFLLLEMNKVRTYYKEHDGEGKDLKERGIE